MPNTFLIPINALFMNLSDYLNEYKIDRIEFGPTSQPPWTYANIIKDDQIVLKTRLSEALQNDLEFYNSVINNHLSYNPYRICFNGFGGYHYLTKPTPSLLY